jgi:hypothetical protein
VRRGDAPVEHETVGVVSRGKEAVSAANRRQRLAEETLREVRKELRESERHVDILRRANEKIDALEHECELLRKQRDESVSPLLERAHNKAEQLADDLKYEKQCSQILRREYARVIRVTSRNGDAVWPDDMNHVLLIASAKG